MKPRIPFWFERPEGDEPQSVAQLEKLLAAADNDIKIAEGLEATAREKEAAERAPSAVEACEAAMTETARLRRFRAILRDDLEKAQEREHEAELARLRERKTELEGLLSHEALVEAAAPLVTEEVAALRRVAEIRAERRKLHDEKRALANELHAARSALGENPIMLSGFTPAWEAIDEDPVCKAIDSMRAEVGEEMWDLLAPLKPDRNSYSPISRVAQALAAMQQVEAQRAANR